jgi:hypothetical protein
MIRPRDLRYLLVVLVISSILSSGFAYRVLNPVPIEPFFATWVLGRGGLLQDYFPQNNSTLTTEEKVTWNLGVYNHMGTLEYVSLQVKLLNSTMAGPSDTSAGTAPAILEFDRVLTDNETWTMPFVWEISSMNETHSTIKVTGLGVNGNLISGALGEAVKGYNFRLVFEVWYFDEASNDLTFSWQSSAGMRTSWVQVWFNATLGQ